MSNSMFANVPAAFTRAGTMLVSTDSTKLKVVVDTYAAAAAVDTTTPVYYGGCTLTDITAAGTVFSREIQLWIATARTTVSGGATGAVTFAASTITRASGSFLTDGFKIGSQVTVFAGSDAAAAVNEGVIGTITAVTALQITVSGTPFTAGAEANGARICSVRPKYTGSVIQNAGLSAAVPNTDLLHACEGDSFANRDELKLGANQLLAAKVTTAVGGGEYVAIDCEVARY